MNSRDQAQEDHYLQTVVRMAERLILPEHALEGHYPYFDRIQGHHRPASATLADQRIKEGRLSWQEAMDLELASMFTSGRTGGRRAEGLAEVRLRAAPSDAIRAQRRASLLERLLGVTTMPLVITAQASRHLRAEAEALKVRIIVFNPAGEFAPEEE